MATSFGRAAERYRRQVEDRWIQAGVEPLWSVQSAVSSAAIFQVRWWIQNASSSPSR